MRIAASNRYSELLEKLSKNNTSCIKVEVTDRDPKITTTYYALKAAARALTIDRRYLENSIYFKPVLERYTFKLDLDDANINSINKNVQKTSLKVKVTTIDTKKVTIYSSISAAAKALGYRQPSISLYIKENRTKPFKR